MILGTPLYMAPEQWANHRRLDGKTDVYSLGVMIFLVLTGRMPFRAADTPSLCFLHCNKAPPSLDSIDPTLPSALVELVARMLAKAPEHRPTMDEVAAALSALQGRPAAPSSQPMLPEPSDLDLVVDDAADESSGVRLAMRSGLGGEHPPLVDPPTAGPPPQPAEPTQSQSLPGPPSAASILPGWEDDNVTTTSLGLAVLGSTRSVTAPAPSLKPELSDQSLLVGSQYNLRPVRSYRTWISTAALLVVVLLIVRLNFFHFGAARGRGESVGSPPEPPHLTPVSSPSAAAAPAEVVARTKLKKNCQHMIPNRSCVGSQPLTPAQQAAFFSAFLHSEASLCPGDRLVVSGLPDAPRLQVTPKSMPRKARASLLHDLKELPGSLGLPAQLEILCPEPE